MTGPQLSAQISFSQLRSELSDACVVAQIPKHHVVLSSAITTEHRRNSRRYAQMYFDRQGVPVFEFAEQTLWLPYQYRLGLYAHEIGHALDPKADEDGADAAGMRALNLLIMYDHRWPGKGLQTAVW